MSRCKAAAELASESNADGSAAKLWVAFNPVALRGSRGESNADGSAAKLWVAFNPVAKR